jgi:hypothetical protein
MPGNTGGTSGMNTVAKGARNERRSIELLESLGYNCVRAAASRGVFDIVAIGQSDIVLVQVKSTEWPRAAEMDSLRMFRAPAGVRKLVHRWRARQRTPDVRELTTA